MDIKLKCDTAWTSVFEGMVLADLEGVAETDLIAATVDIPLEKIVAEIGPNDLLDAIGKDKCMEYFNLYEEE